MMKSERSRESRPLNLQRIDAPGRGDLRIIKATGLQVGQADPLKGAVAEPPEDQSRGDAVLWLISADCAALTRPGRCFRTGGTMSLTAGPLVWHRRRCFEKVRSDASDTYSRYNLPGASSNHRESWTNANSPIRPLTAQRERPCDSPHPMGQSRVTIGPLTQHHSGVSTLAFPDALLFFPSSACLSPMPPGPAAPARG